MKKSYAKKNFDKYFFLKLIWNVYMLKNIKIRANKISIGGLHLPKPPGLRGAGLHSPTGALPPGSVCFWIKSLWPTGHRVSLFSVSESGSETVGRQKKIVENFPEFQTLQMKSLLNKKNKNILKMVLHVYASEHNLATLNDMCVCVCMCVL